MVAFNISQHCRHHYGSIIFSTPVKTWNLISIWSSQWWMKHWSVHKIHRPALKQCISLIGSGSGALFQKPNPPPQEETFLSYMFWQKLLCRALLRNLAESVDPWGLGTTLSFFVPLSLRCLWLTELCFDSDLNLSSKNNLKSVMSKLLQHFSWTIAETICHSNSWNKMCQQDECLVHAHCNADRDGREKKSVRFQRVLGKQK